MSNLASLLLAALGGVVAAAPIAPLTPAAPETRETAATSEKPERPEKPEKKDHSSPATARVVLRSVGEHERAPGLDGQRPAVTPDLTPAMRARRLPAPAAYDPPVLPPAGDLRAGLLAIPPPRA